MSEHTPQAKVVRALGAAAKVQSTAPDPRAKIEAALWQMFFELPLSTLLEVRDRAVNPAQTEFPLLSSVVDPDEEPLHMAASQQVGGKR